MAKPGTGKLLGNLGGHQALRVLAPKLGRGQGTSGVLGNSFLSCVHWQHRHPLSRGLRNSGFRTVVGLSEITAVCHMS